MNVLAFMHKPGDYERRGLKYQPRSFIITNKEYEEFQRYKSDKVQGKILTPDGLRFIIEANEYDAQKIGQHFLDMLPKIREWMKKEYEL